MKTSCLLLALGISVVAIGCNRKADPIRVKGAVEGSIYRDRSIFDTLCGFKLDPMYTATTQVEVTDIDAAAEPMTVGTMVPGTAKLHLTRVHRAGVDKELTCDARVGFNWGSQAKYVTDRTHRVGETSQWYVATDFKKL